MILGFDYIFLSSIIILFIIPLYIYRKKVFKFLYNKDDFPSFLKDFKTFSQIIFPKIKFDFSKIDMPDKSLTPDVQKVLVIENILNQYIEHKYIKKTQINIKKELLWGSYELDSIPKKNSIPKDLSKRKELTLSRDNHKCNRCGKSIKTNTSMLLLVKPIENEGTYHFENLTVVCNDCHRIINNNNPSKILKDLVIYDILIKKYIK